MKPISTKNPQGDPVGGDSFYGKVCRIHWRWVGRAQRNDPCWAHTFNPKKGVSSPAAKVKAEER